MATGLTCQTAPGVVFETRDELLEHYRSEWHTYNLKRKVAGLPLVGKVLFERVAAQSAARAEAALAGPERSGTAHHKRTEAAELRREKAAARREAMEEFREQFELQQTQRMQAARQVEVHEEEDEGTDSELDGSDDDSDGEWEEMSGDEAEEALAEAEAAAREAAAEAEAEAAEDAESQAYREQALALIAKGEGPISMARGGLELVLGGGDGHTGKVIGSREMQRYYKQRPKPQESRDAVLATKASSKERGMTLGRKEFSQVDEVTKKSQQAEKRYRRKQEAKNAMERAVANKQLPRNVPY
mmetsp:Transcript_22877/g.77854  ORF Transcript_22877/g.77854 Transcript_22877/m.77854 type:complete len:301 (-) Transcript_22877:238-1140(-)|eukprot:CAMPEP_0183790122 /NCGR_PEP_ID=MMETSP0803_2-20130417/812_1 /TAXON_ID=195967 /ORGANISM="Crustomastix stigmata, Strain CCMP3273" /LENGTH=300 /DNA_ID=CAMNT_0026034313 /DNA_START=54 /DNA_END=956 /DNA_ORIENTATION=+